MIVCDCCLQEKASAQPRPLGKATTSRRPSGSLPKVFNLCFDCVVEMRNEHSAAQRWRDERLK